jgi:hypothetical protein
MKSYFSISFQVKIIIIYILNKLVFLKPTATSSHKYKNYSVQHISLLLKYTYTQGYMFQFHTAIIRLLTKNRSISDFSYRVRQKYLTILQNSCEWNRWHGEFVLECSSSETQSISVSMERWSVEHRASAVGMYFKNNDSVVTQLIFRQYFSIHWNKCP